MYPTLGVVDMGSMIGIIDALIYISVPSGVFGIQSIPDEAVSAGNEVWLIFGRKRRFGYFGRSSRKQHVNDLRCPSVVGILGIDGWL